MSDQKRLRSSSVKRTAIDLRNVDFRFSGEIGFFVESAAATLAPKDPGESVDLDHIDRFIIRIHRGEVLLQSSDLTALFNQHILDYPNAPLKNISITTSAGRLTADARLILDKLPNFELRSRFAGTISLTADYKLTYELDDIRIFGVQVAGLLKKLRGGLPKLITVEREGVSLQDFSLLLNHRQMFPVLELEGDIAAVSLTEMGLHLRFADSPNVAFITPSSLGESYIWIQSGDPKLIGLVITNAQIAILPKAKTGPLKFDLYHYREQLSRATGRINADSLMTLTMDQ